MCCVGTGGRSPTRVGAKSVRIGKSASSVVFRWSEWKLVVKSNWVLKFVYFAKFDVFFVGNEILVCKILKYFIESVWVWKVKKISILYTVVRICIRFQFFMFINIIIYVKYRRESPPSCLCKSWILLLLLCRNMISLSLMKKIEF